MNAENGYRHGGIDGTINMSRKNGFEMGEKRNSYIPANPESYYTKLGQWISWDHFLGKNKKMDDDPPTTNTNE